MKKIVAILLLFSLFLPFLGTISLFNIQKYQAKKELKRKLITGLEDSALVLLVFTKKEKESLYWEHEKEFKYQGFMYDIVKQKVEGTRYFYWCWKDHKETLLYKKLEKLVALALGDDPLQKQNQLQLKWFHNLLFFKSETPYSFTVFTEEKNHKKFNYSNNYTSLQIIPTKPPPLRFFTIKKTS